LHACAYWLMDALRRKLMEGGTRRMQLGIYLIKIGGRVRELMTKASLHLREDSRHEGPGRRAPSILLLALIHEHPRK
jgi:hypothetical protein